MPTIAFAGQTLTCAVGDNLRQVLLQAGADLYNGPAAVINCHGLGTCGTCAVAIEGAIEGAISPPTAMEKLRLRIPPHSGLESGRRLACQVQVLGDLKVTKYVGFWGQGATRRDGQAAG